MATKKTTTTKKTTRTTGNNDVEAQPSRSRPANTTLSSSGGGGSPNYSMDMIQLCFLGQIFCALVLLLVFQLNNKNSNYYGYGMAVAIVAMIFSFLGMVLYSARYDDYGRTVASSITIGNLITKFLCLWWFVAAIVLTFGKGPFTSTSNGYFAVWGGVLCSVGAAADGVTSRSTRSAVLGMMICSIVLLIAIIAGPDNSDSSHINGPNRSEALYALLIAVFTLLLVLLIFFVPTPLNSNASVALIVFSVFAIVWIVLPFLTTFRGPFIVTGNGYFASWIGALCATIAAAGAYNSVN